MQSAECRMQNEKKASASRPLSKGKLQKVRLVLILVCYFAAAATIGVLAHIILNGVHEFDRSNWGSLVDHVGAQFADVSTLLGENAARDRIRSILRRQDFVKTFEYEGNGTGIRIQFDAEMPIHEHHIHLYTYTPVGSRAFWLILFNPVWYGILVGCVRSNKSSQRIILPAMCVLAILPTSIALASNLGISGYLGIPWALTFSAIWAVKPSRHGMIGTLLSTHIAALILITIG